MDKLYSNAYSYFARFKDNAGNICLKASVSFEKYV